MAAVFLVDPGAELTVAQMEVLRLYATGVAAQNVAAVMCPRGSEDAPESGEARYEAHGDAVYTRADLLRAGLRNRYIDQDWYLRGQ